MAKLEPVSEQEAQGAVRDIFESVKSTLRVSVVPLMFRAWARRPEFLEAVWRQLEPVLRTRAFETAADRIRERAVDLVDDLAKLADHLPVMRAAGLSDREIEQVRDTIAVFHYVNPKLLLIAEAVRVAIAEPAAPSREAAQPTPQADMPSGIPAGMVRPAVVDFEAGAGSEQIRTILEEMQTLLDLAVPNTDYVALAHYPIYLEMAWRELKPMVQKRSFEAAEAELRRMAADAVRALPGRGAIDRRLAADMDEAVRYFARILPGLILNVALLARNLYGPEIARRSPFEVATGRGRGRRRAPAPPPERPAGERGGV